MGQLQQRVIDQNEDYVPLMMTSGSCNCWMIATQLSDYAEWTHRSSEEMRREKRGLWEISVDSALRSSGLETVSFFQHQNLLLSLVVGPPSLSAKDIHNILYGVLRLSDDLYLHASISRAFHSSEQIHASCMEAISLLHYAVLSSLAQLSFMMKN